MKRSTTKGVGDQGTSTGGRSSRIRLEEYTEWTNTWGGGSNPTLLSRRGYRSGPTHDQVTDARPGGPTDMIYAGCLIAPALLSWRERRCKQLGERAMGG